MIGVPARNGSDRDAAVVIIASLQPHRRRPDQGNELPQQTFRTGRSVWPLLPTGPFAP
jgi:hypothetical protein